MDDPSDNPPSQDELNTESTKKSCRQATRLKELTISRNSDQRIPVQFDLATGVAFGKNSKKFTSYVALLGRSKPSILKENWKQVETRIKEQIWESVMVTYDVPNIDIVKKKLIQFAGERWKAFKTSLTSRYIFGKLKDKSPLEEYNFLDEETWQRFVEIRKHPNFQELRKKKQELARRNKCPHRLSRGGYRLLEERIMDEKRKKRKEDSQADPSVVVSPPSPPTRHEKWKKARVNKSGEYTSESTRIIAEKIDELVEQSSNGTFQPVGRDDILTTAIGRPEHPGRVRVGGRGVGIRQYYGPRSHHSKSKLVTEEQLEAIREEILQQVRQELASAGFSKGNTNVQSNPSPIPPSTKGSCVPEDVPEDDAFDMPEDCKLYVENPIRLVAYGKVYNLGPIIHNKSFEDDKLRVVVERIIDANAPVPVPTEEVQIVGQALQNFILWPKRLVRPIDNKELDGCGSKKDVPKQPESEDNVFKRLHMVAFDIAKRPIQITREADVFGPSSSIPIYMSGKDIIEVVLGDDMISITVIQFWLIYLHHLCLSKGKTDIYGFIDPVSIQKTGNSSKEIERYIQARLTDGEKLCYLAPYLEDAHWQLLILCRIQNVVVFLCSFGKKPKKEFKAIIDTVMEAYSRCRGQRKKPDWIYPNCRKQIGSYECGYYVMRHMLNVVLANIIDSWKERFNYPHPFSEEEIDDIRTRWANFLLNFANL